MFLDEKKSSKKVKDFDIPAEAKKKKMPAMLKPMLATLTEKPFSDPDWIFELKWDGYRALANVEDGNVLLYSRNLNEYTLYKPVIQALEKIHFKVILDGEIVAHDEKGKVRFERIQNYKRYKNVALTYNVFDILYLDGYSLLEVPLTERKKLLQEILPKDEILVYSEHFDEVGLKVYDFAQKNNLEGIMAKKASGIYQPGKRTTDWLKVKVHLYQEGIIVGYTEPRGNRSFFGTLLLAVKENGKLKYIGTSGGGFSEKVLKEIYELLSPIQTKDNPLPAVPPGILEEIHWVETKYVCEIRFGEWTTEGIMRHPVFKGMRFDKNPEEVVRETPVK